MDYKEGDAVWVRYSWQDADCWAEGVVLKVTPKRIKCRNAYRSDGYYSPINVKKRQDEKTDLVEPQLPRSLI